MAGFTDRYIAALGAKPGAVQSDFQEANRKYRGLLIRVSKTGTKTWVFVYTLNRNRTRMSFGTFPAMSVSEAHERRSSIGDTLKRCRRAIRDPSSSTAMR
jgi:hypothetical protein